MVVAVDTSNHWRFVTGRETVTLFAKVNETVPVVGATVPNAKRWQLAKELILADAMLAKFGLKWSIWLNQIPTGVPPKIGDVLQDQYGVRWVLQRVDVESLGQRFDCTCLMSQKGR